MSDQSVADLEAAGFSHVEARCQCGTITMLPFLMLKARGQVRDNTTLPAIVGRLRCHRCGSPPQSARPWFQYIDCRRDEAGPLARWGGAAPGGDVKP